MGFKMSEIAGSDVWYKNLNGIHLKLKKNNLQLDIQGETELPFRLIPSLTQSHTKPHTQTYI